MSQIRQADRNAHTLIEYSNFLFWSTEYRESHRCALEGLAVLGSNDDPSATLLWSHASYVIFCDLLFLGEWGEAVREIDTCVARLTRNAIDDWAQLLRFWRAWLNTYAMDFAGALAICEDVVRSFGDRIPPPDQRFYLVVAGTAEVALGKHERALAHLSLARHEMDRQTVQNDWYCRLPLESALTELWLAKGDLAQARAQGERFLQVTLDTAERTWQALAWEANARVAMVHCDLQRAQEFIGKALSTVDAFEVPLAAWQVHATAAALAERVGNVESAQRHREMSRETILKIADSLPLGESLRNIFLSASRVAAILGTSAAG